MAIRFDSGDGEVVAGYMESGVVTATEFGLSIKVGLGIRSKSKRNIDSTSVASWQEIRPEGGFLKTGGLAALKVVAKGTIGKALTAVAGTAAGLGHTVRVDFTDGNQSIIELPNRLFLVLTTLLKEQQLPSEIPDTQGNASGEEHGVAQQTIALASRIASTVLDKNVETSPREDTADVESERVEASPVNSDHEEVLDQISKLSDLHTAGILTDEEFSAKKADLLSRL